MKICRFNENRLGIVVGNEVADVTSVLSHLPALQWPVPPGDQFVRHLAFLKGALTVAVPKAVKSSIDGLRLLSPIANPSKVIAAPVNYAKHQAEANADAAINLGADIKTIEHYGLFLKSSTSVVGPSQGIALPDLIRRIDHEVEVVAVIGKECFRVAENEAMDYMAGYCIGLDMSVRGTEDRSWRKSYDTFTVLGPYLVTADEIADPGNLDLLLDINGERRQSSNTQALIFNIPKLVAYASAGYRLYPGDVIMTGTPEGVGPVEAGDVLVATVSKIGHMTVKVSAPVVA